MCHEIRVKYNKKCECDKTTVISVMRRDLLLAKIHIYIVSHDILFVLQNSEIEDFVLESEGENGRC